MVALDHGAAAVSLAAFDDFRLLGVDLENKLFAVPILDWADPNVLQRYDALRYVLSRVLEVVKTPVVEDKPTTLPGFPASSLTTRNFCYILLGHQFGATRVSELKRNDNNKICNANWDHNVLERNRNV